MFHERPSPIKIFGPEWNYESVKKDFEKAGITFTPKKFLTKEQIITCSVGKISLEKGGYVEGVDFLKEEGGEYFVRGIKDSLFQYIEERNLGTPIKLDDKPENIYGLLITNPESLKEFTDFAKAYCQPSH